MATTLKTNKPCRMDLRLAQVQRANYEQAASLMGQTLSQWATQHLDEAAKNDIDEARYTQLAPNAFESFLEMLESPLPEKTQKLLERKEIWK